MIRNSTRYISWKERKEICADLKTIYSAPSEKVGLDALDEFGKKWDVKYPMISKSWRVNWDNLSEFFAYPTDIRRQFTQQMQLNHLIQVYARLLRRDLLSRRMKRFLKYFI